MASGKGPSNDFAPAWLKIPAQPSSNGSSYGGGGHGEKSNGRNGDGFPPHYSGPRAIQRQRSFDTRYNDPRPNSNKYRHHSLDGYYDDYYYGYYDDYYGYQSYLNQAQSYQRNNKYQHPNARPGYDPFSYYQYGYAYEHNFAEPPYFVNSAPYYSYEGMKNERNTSSRKNHSNKECFNTEFPTLGNGTSSKSSGSPAKTSNGGVWDKPNNKVFSQPNSNSTPTPDTPNQQDSKDSSKGVGNIYKASVSSKGLSARKPPTEDSSNDSHDGDKPNSVGDYTSKHGITDSNSNKINGFHQDSHPVDIVNGVARLQVNTSPRRDDVFLSSSLEAEQRLLREMGWDEADEDEYEITEDDLREFQNLSKQIKEQCNGQIKSTQRMWTGTDAVSAAPVANTDEVDAPDSSDESDLDSD